MAADIRCTVKHNQDRQGIHTHTDGADRHLASRTPITHPLHQSWPLFLISRATNNISVLPFHWAIIPCHCCQKGAPPLPSLLLLLLPQASLIVSGISKVCLNLLPAASHLKRSSSSLQSLGSSSVTSLASECIG